MTANYADGASGLPRGPGIAYKLYKYETVTGLRMLFASNRPVAEQYICCEIEHFFLTPRYRIY